MENREETGMEKHWVDLAEELGKADKELVENVNTSIDSLLTFVRFQLLSPSSHVLTGGCPQAGLLSAVQSAFAIATYPLLQPSSAVASPPIQPLQPKLSALTMNVFVFSSLTLALICASVGILRKTQLKQHLAWMSKRTDARAQIVERQLSYELNSRRMLWDSARHFSWGLTLSIGLFAVGIFVFLWTMSWVVALAVLLFACFTLCVVFSRDIPHISRRCIIWVLLTISSLLVALYNRYDPDDPYYDPKELAAESGPSVADQVRLLSHAIMSRASGLTASGVDPNVGRLGQSIVGLGRLPDSTSHWSVLDPRMVTEASSESAGLGRVLDIVLAILQDRDPLKGGYSIPLSLWDRVKGYLTLRLPKPSKRQIYPWSKRPDPLVYDDMEEPDWLVSDRYHPWMIWLFDALRQCSVEERCLLADALSGQLALYLRVTGASRGSTSGTGPVREKFLDSAFCLAFVLFQWVPPGVSKLKLRWIIASAGVRLQLSDLPSGALLTSLRENMNSLIWDGGCGYLLPTIDSEHSGQSAYAEEGEHLSRLCAW
jgi:hypothetical protein